MLTKMFMFEWRYFVRQPSFYVTSLIFFFLTFFATVSENVQIGGGGNVLYNGPFSIAQTLVIMGLFAMFLVVNFVASTATRNDTSKMSELLYSKPINPTTYQLGRFLGSFAVVLTVFSFVPLGILMGTLIGGVTGWVDVERLGETHLSYYLTAFFYLSLPTLFVLSCFFYAVAIRFRSMMAVYLSAVGLFILYTISGQFLSEPEYRAIAALADPFAFNTLGEITRYWTMFDKNNTVIEMSGVLLENRLLWIVVGVVIMALFGGFRNLERLPKQKKAKKAKTVQTDFTHLLGNNLKHRSQGENTLSQLLHRTRFEVRQVVFSAPFLILGALTVFLLVAPLVDPTGMFGTPNWPLTQMMVEHIAGSTGMLMLIVLAYYSAEIVWRERSSGMGDIIDSMPVKNITFWLSKLVAICLVMVLLYVFGMLVTVSNQFIQGYSNIEISQYVARLGYVYLLPLFMTAVLAFFLQIISPNKYVGMMLFVLYIISTIVLSNFGFSHNMFHFGQAPTVLYSDINGFGTYLTAHSWYLLYWGAFTVILGVLGYALWHRGPSQPLKVRFSQLGYQLALPGKLAVAASVAVFIASGSYIHYNTRVLNEFMVQDDREQLQADYEKKYVQYKDAQIPTIIATNVNVDIYPYQRKLSAEAKIVVKNTSEQVIERFLVSRPSSNTTQWDVQIDGGKLVEHDEQFNLAWFEFEQPLLPGEQRQGLLISKRENNGFADAGEDVKLVENGTFLNNYEIFPNFGYVNSYQLTDRHKRRQHDLEPLQRANKLEDTAYYNESFFGKGVGFIEFEATVTTAEDQFAIAPGYLQSETVKEGRRTFHYKMDAPMVNFYSVMSAKLERKHEQYQGIDIEVYYHKDHHMNIDRMIESVRDSIDYFTLNFGPYQHKQMRIIEFPGYQTFAQSFANTVPYSEKIGFITDLRDPENIDPVYYVTAHEVAHQWWGHQVGAANVQGSAIISESLSQYSALMVMEKKYGEDKIRKFLKYELDRYLRGRTVEFLEEMPLMRSENQQYIHYRKGSVVMMSLKDRLGEARLNKALQGFLQEYKYQSAPYPTTVDLVRYINQDTNEQEQQFVSNLFEHITLYDLKTTEVVIAEQADENGYYNVAMTVEAKLQRADGQGQETEVPFSDSIDIGLFSADPDDLTADNPVLYLKKHAIQSGTNVIELKVKEKPLYAGVDPFIKLVDRDSGDNIKKL